ncbi:phage baseplate assembly protein V [Pseudomonas sp. CCI3.2]|uniref:phage baseplate assembly protein V n=1 Tax=unclassified Pseudomonas TaxID=196821 RepID=UPI002B23C1A6|nr:MULTISPECIES: phage baseplate assembly protein V [unclassified Pseudomonas]MEB0078002.1 phage baseplate assembly protein V [Pseudomonas sp. MH10out]MEB0104326.1 phage baseplate assembly protein V [Pseudomonas sp. CCI3.2]MEB0133515.1 phage baseplate assembly protein V [Pseudomonas sp. CCI2.4]
MIGQLTNALRQHQSDGSSAPRKGTISGYDPLSHGVKVTVQPEGFDTGWIQLSALGVGNGWGVLTGPQLGDEVGISFDGGDPNLGHVTGRYFNDGAPPPAVPSGETWIVHQSGSLLKFHNDGTIEIKAAGGISYTATAHQFHGPITTDNSITAAGDVVAGTVSLESHIHGGGTISGKTSAPIA